uniref:Reticulon 4 receptor n=1 Tax=Eptatretus burgeri TaxID=7764 RepID=A0A8C4PYC9_EPTBU
MATLLTGSLFLSLFLISLTLGSSCPPSCSCPISPPTLRCQWRSLINLPSPIPVETHRLFLQNNRVSVLRYKALTAPQALTLWLSSNALEHIEPAAFSGLPRLEELDLGDNPGLQHLSQGVFSGLPALRTLHLYRCGLIELSNGLFSGLFALRNLYLQENHLTYLPGGSFAELSNLNHLFLHGNRLRMLAPTAFHGLTSLDRLLLHHNYIEVLPVTLLVGLESLTTLFLFGNNLTGLQEGTLDHAQALRYLRLNDNPWHCDCQAKPLWRWLAGFQGASSAVPCALPPELVGRNLRSLPPATFAHCRFSENKASEEPALTTHTDPVTFSLHNHETDPHTDNDHAVEASFFKVKKQGQNHHIIGQLAPATSDHQCTHPPIQERDDGPVRYSGEPNSRNQGTILCTPRSLLVLTMLVYVAAC